MSQPAQVFAIEIKATPEKVWEAITSPDWTRRYFHDTAIRSDWRKGSRVVWELPDGSPASDGEVLEIEWPRRLVTTWLFHYDPEMAAETPSRVTWEIEDLGGLVPAHRHARQARGCAEDVRRREGRLGRDHPGHAQPARGGLMPVRGGGFFAGGAIAFIADGLLHLVAQLQPPPPGTEAAHAAMVAFTVTALGMTWSISDAFDVTGLSFATFSILVGVIDLYVLRALRPSGRALTNLAVLNALGAAMLTAIAGFRSVAPPFILFGIVAGLFAVAALRSRATA